MTDRPPLFYSLLEKLLAKGAKVGYNGPDYRVLEMSLRGSKNNRYISLKVRLPGSSPGVTYDYAIFFDTADRIWTIVKEGDVFVLKKRAGASEE